MGFKCCKCGMDFGKDRKSLLRHIESTKECKVCYNLLNNSLNNIFSNIEKS